MSDVTELYQEVILDHSKRPRNFREMADADRTAVGHNPLCGDRVTVFLKLDGERIADIAFVGQGCAISKASASLMSEVVKGRTAAEAERLFGTFHEMVTRDDARASPPADLGKLAVLAGVSEFPVRVKCATLAWHTLRSALAGREAPATTE